MIAQKKPAIPFRGMAGISPGDDLLSRDLSSHYHWRGSVSLPGSEWDRVGPLRCGHQEAGTWGGLPLGLACGVTGILTTVNVGGLSVDTSDILKRTSGQDWRALPV